jgi:DnaJ-class molecular chaperone
MSAPEGKQPCFICQGEGKIWPFEGKRGIPDNCKVCNGSKYIEDYYVKCPHCNGTNKIYDNDDGRGFPKDCNLCNKKGYIDFVVTECTRCNHLGKIWPFEGK